MVCFPGIRFAVFIPGLIAFAVADEEQANAHEGGGSDQDQDSAFQGLNHAGA